MTTPKMTTTNDIRGRLVELFNKETDPNKAAVLSDAIFDSLQKEISCNFIMGKDQTTGAEIRATVGSVAVHYTQEMAVQPPVEPNRKQRRSAKHRRG